MFFWNTVAHNNRHSYPLHFPLEIGNNISYNIKICKLFFWTRRIVRFDIEEHFLFLWNTSQTVKIGDVAGDRFSNRHRPTSTDKLQKTITYHFPCFCCDLCYTLWHPQLNSWNNHTRSQWAQSPNFEPFHWDHVISSYAPQRREG